MTLNKAEGRGKNHMGIVFDTPLCVYKPQAILNTFVDGGVLNPEKKR
ncbi:hypothetical protein [Okeania sp. SIO1I7]|nr:hypothetical protein [Okeania sp. SIO1I7]NET26728.1 hypothetical protein [Okeania sp. SIO1I7]